MYIYIYIYSHVGIYVNFTYIYICACILTNLMEYDRENIFSFGLVPHKIPFDS